jgi:hypothetical protein
MHVFNRHAADAWMPRGHPDLTEIEYDEHP